MNREIKCECGYSTENKKSFSNHVRFGCKIKIGFLLTNTSCVYCGSLLPKRKPSEHGIYCNRDCYTAHRDGKLRGPYGNGVIMISGYMYEYSPDHPGCTNHGYVAQHRLIAEKKIGRYLRRDEVAHHINENKLDNSPSNIEVMTASQHSKHHQNFRKCKIA